LLRNRSALWLLVFNHVAREKVEKSGKFLIRGRKAPDVAANTEFRNRLRQEAPIRRSVFTFNRTRGIRQDLMNSMKFTCTRTTHGQITCGVPLYVLMELSLGKNIRTYKWSVNASFYDFA
jgi:hypothetical protein